MRSRGCEFLDGRRVTGLSYDEETGRISEVVCGKETYNADAVILAVGISTLQELIMNRYALSNLEHTKLSCFLDINYSCLLSCFDWHLFYIVQYCVLGRSF